MLLRLLIVVSVLSLGVSGCVSSVTLAQEDRQRIRTIVVSQDVKLPAEIYYRGPEGLIPFAGLALSRDQGKDLRDQLQQHGINVGEIVRTAFVRRLKGRPEWAAKIADEGGDATIHLEIDLYGIEGAFGTGKPMLGVVARLNHTSKGIVWRRREYVTHLNDKTASFPVTEYFRNPQAVRTAFESAAEVVVDLLWEHLAE